MINFQRILYQYLLMQINNENTESVYYAVRYQLLLTQINAGNAGLLFRQYQADRIRDDMDCQPRPPEKTRP